MLDELVAIRGGESLFHFAGKPFVVACQLDDEALHRLEHKRLAFPPPLGRDSSQLAFELRWKMHVHATSLEV